MRASKDSLNGLRKRIAPLREAKRHDMCWQMGWFKVPMFVKEPGEAPLNPYLLVCIDTASRFVLGDLLLKETPRPEDYLSLLVASMEAPFPGDTGSARPRSVQLNDSAALRLLRREMGSLGIEFQLAEELRFVQEFAGISEREFFSQRLGFKGRQN